MKHPLEGIRVLDWGVFHAGPGAAAMLGDLGADVIKIERPGTGDPSRTLGRIGEVDFTLPKGRNLFFEAANRSKKSVAIDLSQDMGKAALYRLASQSDVFLTNFRPSVIEHLQMTYTTLSRFNPQIIYSHVSGYGPRGVDADRGAFDPQGQAQSGMMYALGEPDMPPLLAHFAIVDQATAIMGCLQTVLALLMRERVGIGQEVHTSILGAALYIQYFNVMTALLTGKAVPRHQRSTSDPVRNHYCCQDGKWLMLTLTPPDQYWTSLCEALGHPELAADPRFARADIRFQNSRALVEILDSVFATRPREEWASAFRERGFPFAPVNSPLELTKDAQIMDNGYIVDFDHPVFGKVRIPGFPIHFSNAEAGTAMAAPELGADTAWVLKNVGGYTDEEIGDLERSNVIQVGASERS